MWRQKYKPKFVTSADVNRKQGRISKLGGRQRWSNWLTESANWPHSPNQVHSSHRAVPVIHSIKDTCCHVLKARHYLHQGNSSEGNAGETAKGHIEGGVDGSTMIKHSAKKSGYGP